MIIRIDDTKQAIDIIEPSNFKAFSVQVGGRSDGTEKLLASAVVKHDGDHAWISENWLREWPPLRDEPWWQNGLTAMISAAERYGWVDRGTSSIQAHIEYGPS